MLQSWIWMVMMRRVMLSSLCTMVMAVCCLFLVLDVVLNGSIRLHRR